MTEKKRIMLLISINTVLIFLVTIIVSFHLYNVAIKEEKNRLVETAQSQARLIEAVGRFDSVESRDFNGGSVAATLSQIVDAHNNYMGFGMTGEFTMAMREGDNIVFLLSHRHGNQIIPDPIPFDSKIAEPMRLALSGKSGTIIGLDYRGVVVLAAYEPVNFQNWGIVAKIDLAEVQAPFIKAGVTIGLIAVFISLLAGFSFLKLTQPLILEISEKEKRFQSIFNQSAVGIAVVDPDGYFISVNSHYEDIVGYSKSELKKHTYLDITHPDDTEKATNLYRQALGSKKNTYHDEKRYIRKTGEIVWALIGISVVRNAHGDADYYIAVINNVSSRKKSEEQLRQSETRFRELSEKLEEIVNLRTTELKEVQKALVRKEKLAAVGELAGGIGHELRNPLGVISNAIYFLKDIIPETDIKIYEYLDIIGVEVESANKIISDLLDFAKSKPTQPKSVPAAKIIADALDRYPPPGRLEVIKEINDGNVYVDAQQIRMVVSNVLTNAYQAMPDGGKLTINSHMSQENCVIEISDTGHGISDEHKALVFEPLFSTRIHGIGLGLAISKRLIELNKGTIDFKSETGKGTTFRISIPRKLNV